MARIRSLRPNVTREEATEHFSSGMFDFLRESTFGPLRSVADFYIPFRLFQIEIVNSGKRDSRIFGLDAVNGSLDLYTFEQLPGEREVFYLETRNCSEPLLGEAESIKTRHNESAAPALQHRIFPGAEFADQRRASGG